MEKVVKVTPLQRYILARAAEQGGIFTELDVKKWLQDFQKGDTFQQAMQRAINGGGLALTKARVLSGNSGDA